MDEQFVISVCSVRTNTRYFFGPFSSDNEMMDFDNRIWQTESYDYDSIDYGIINSPETFGTGNEVSES